MTFQLQEAFNKFKTEMAARRVEMDQKLNELREKLSPAAKEADEALTRIMKDSSLSPVERREQIREMFNTLPVEVKMELREMRRGMGNK